MIGDQQYERVRSEGNLTGEFPEEKIKPHLEAAEIKLRRLITDDVYDAVAEADDPGDNMTDMDADERKVFFLAKGEALLACHFGAPVWNLNSEGDGYNRAQGFGDGRHEIMSSEEVEQVAARFLERAMEYIQPYVPVPDPDDEDADDTLTAGSIGMAAI